MITQPTLPDSTIPDQNIAESTATGPDIDPIIAGPSIDDSTITTPNITNTTIAVIGLGHMGRAIAERLLAAKFKVVVYNRTATRCQPLVLAGASAAATPKLAASQANIVISSLFDDQAVTDLTLGKDGIAAGLSPNAIHIETSTILPTTTQQLMEHYQTHTPNRHFLVGTILGVPALLAKGGVTTLVAGPGPIRTRCEPIFSVYSQRIMAVGEQPYLANVMKICANTLLASAVDAMSVIYTYAEKNKLSAAVIHQFCDTVFAHPAFQRYADVLEQLPDHPTPPTNFALETAYKDLCLIRDAYQEAQVPIPLIESMRAKLDQAIAQHMGKMDFSAVHHITRQQADLCNQID